MIVSWCCRAAAFEAGRAHDSEPECPSEHDHEGQPEQGEEETDPAVRQTWGHGRVRTSASAGRRSSPARAPAGRRAACARAPDPPGRLGARRASRRAARCRRAGAPVATDAVELEVQPENGDVHEHDPREQNADHGDPLAGRRSPRAACARRGAGAGAARARQPAPGPAAVEQRPPLLRLLGNAEPGRGGTGVQRRLARGRTHGLRGEDA